MLITEQQCDAQSDRSAWKTRRRQRQRLVSVSSCSFTGCLLSNNIIDFIVDSRKGCPENNLWSPTRTAAHTLRTTVQNTASRCYVTQWLHQGGTMSGTRSDIPYIVFITLSSGFNKIAANYCLWSWDPDTNNCHVRWYNWFWQESKEVSR